MVKLNVKVKAMILNYIYAECFEWKSNSVIWIWWKPSMKI